MLQDYLLVRSHIGANVSQYLSFFFVANIVMF